MSENLLDIKNLQITFNTSSDEKDFIKAVSGINMAALLSKFISGKYMKYECICPDPP